MGTASRQSPGRYRGTPPGVLKSIRPWSGKPAIYRAVNRNPSIWHTVLPSQRENTPWTVNSGATASPRHPLRSLPGLRPVGIPGEGDCPLFFPVRLNNRDEVRSHLQSEKIYCPVHWPMEGVLAENRESVQYSHEELSLPIDQRYGKADMQRLGNALRKLME